MPSSRIVPKTNTCLKSCRTSSTVHAFAFCVRLREYNVTIGVALPDDSSSLASLYIILYGKAQLNYNLLIFYDLKIRYKINEIQITCRLVPIFFLISLDGCLIQLTASILGPLEKY